MTASKVISELAKRALPAPVQRAIRAALYRRQLASFRPRDIQESFLGETLAVRLVDATSEKWYGRGAPPIAPFEWLRARRLRPGAKVFYVGAHHAVYPLVVARWVGEGGRVVAVEANPDHIAAARDNVRLNAASNIEIVHAACGAVRGTLRFRFGHNVSTGRDDEPTFEVPAMRIDDLAKLHGAPDVVLIDVEGYELKVLEGAEDTLEAMPDLCVEVHAGCGLEEMGASVAGIAGFLEKRGYRLMMARDYGKAEVLPFDASAALVRERFQLIAIPAEGTR